MRFRIAEERCVNCGACRRFCPIDVVSYAPAELQHRIRVEECIGCTICYAVCPADAIEPLPDPRRGRPLDLSWPTMQRVMVLAYNRGPVKPPGMDGSG